MADDPLFGFKPAQQPAPSDDPLMGFKPAPAAQASSGYGILDYLHSASQGLTAATRVATDWPTFGLVDKLFGSQAQADTAAAHKQMGAWDLPLSLAGSAVSAGPELQAASKIGGALAPTLAKLPFTGSGKWLGGVLSSGAVGAPISGLGEYGHEAGWTPDVGAIGNAAKVGAALSAAGGTLGGVVGRGGELAAPNAVDDLRAAAKARYAGNDPVIFDGPGTVHPAFAAADDAVARANLTGQQFDLAKSTKAALSDFRDKPQFTATDLDKAQGRFDKIASSPNSTDQDKWIAPYYSAAIEDVMKNGTPFNAPTGWAAETRDAADKLHGMAEDTQRLNDWITRSKVSGGPDVGDQARSYMLSKGTYAQPGAPGYDELNRLAGTGAGKDISAAPSAYDVRHGLHPLASALASGAATGVGGQIAEGHFDPASLAAETLLGMGLGFGVHRAVPWAQRQYFQGPAQQRAIDAYRTAASTGQPQAAVMPTTPLRDTIRRLIYGGGGSGAY